MAASKCTAILEVRATALVKGKLHVGTLRIEEGALLDGQLQMAGALTAASVQGADLPADLPRPRTSKTARAGRRHPFGCARANGRERVTQGRGGLCGSKVDGRLHPACARGDPRREGWDAHC